METQEQPKETTAPEYLQCTHIKANGIRCGSPALKNQYFCYFHTSKIKTVSCRVDQRLSTLAILEDRHAIQSAIMEVTNMVLNDEITLKKASALTKLLQLAVRNGRKLEFDSEETRSKMVTEVPDYAAQYLAEHPEDNQPATPQAEPDPEPDPILTMRFNDAREPLRKKLVALIERQDSEAKLASAALAGRGP